MFAQDYDISFLITNFHTEAMYKSKVVDFVIDFIQVPLPLLVLLSACARSTKKRHAPCHCVQDVDKEISEMKLGVNSRGAPPLPRIAPPHTHTHHFIKFARPRLTLISTLQAA